MSDLMVEMSKLMAVSVTADDQEEVNAELAKLDEEMAQIQCQIDVEKTWMADQQAQIKEEVERLKVEAWRLERHRAASDDVYKRRRDGTSHPDLHLIYVDEVCGLFKLAGLPEDEVKKKVFPLSLKDKALTCAKYGLDSEIVASLCESFASHIDLPKEKWFKYHPPLEVNVVKPNPVEERVIAYNDPVVPSAYIEKPPFPVRIKDHSKASTVIRRGYIRTPTPPEKIRVEPSIAMIKDLLSDNVDGHNIHFCEDAARIAKPHARDKHRHVVGTPVLSVKIGDHCYHGLCDVGASVSAIPQSLYDEIKDEIAPVEIEPIDVTIQLANRDTICPVGIIRDVEVLCGKTKYPADFIVLSTAQDSFCPIIFGRPFLNTVNAHIDCEKQIVTVGFEGVSHEFSFSKFGRQPHEKELPSKDETIALASIVMPPNDPLEQYLLQHENDMHMDERDEIDRVVLEQYPILNNNLPVELLGDPPPPKGDPVFELKQLRDTLKYAYLDEMEIYLVIISASLSEHEENKLLKTPRKHRAAIGYTLDDLKAISRTLCQHKIKTVPDSKPVAHHQMRLNPNMKELLVWKLGRLKQKVQDMGKLMDTLTRYAESDGTKHAGSDDENASEVKRGDGAKDDFQTLGRNNNQGDQGKTRQQDGASDFAANTNAGPRNQHRNMSQGCFQDRGFSRRKSCNYEELLKGPFPKHSTPDASSTHSWENCFVMQEFRLHTSREDQGGNNGAQQGQFGPGGHKEARSVPFLIQSNPKKLNGGQYHVLTTSACKREKKVKQRANNIAGSVDPRYLHWSEQPVTWSRADHPRHIDNLGNLALVVAPQVGAYMLSKVLMDGGSSINILYYDTFWRMNFDEKDLMPSTMVFHGIVPGKLAYPVGRIKLNVAFGDESNYRSGSLMFEAVKIKSPCHALFGRPAYAQFMARPCHVYLKLKMTGLKGNITVNGDRKIAQECEEGDAAYVESACAVEEFKFHKGNVDTTDMSPLKKPMVDSEPPLKFKLAYEQIDFIPCDSSKQFTIGTSLDPK
ncbi:hypothetical protein ZWY2020_035651 [Hordeum vulgare]|nr:hypothetical protein ZWY2020_035651 [Hordeum vulgare]